MLSAILVPRQPYAEAAYHAKFSASDKHLTCKNSPEPNTFFLANSTGLREYKLRTNIRISQLKLKILLIHALYKSSTLINYIQTCSLQITSNDQV